MDPWLVVGLGNPGPEYGRTRHNVGVMVVESLAERWGGRLKSHRPTHCEVMEGRYGGRQVVLARTRGYMNESGGPVKALVGYYDVEPDHLIVVHDELDIPFGALRIKEGGGDGGHNGLRSIRRSLVTGDTIRLRVGIGRPPGRQDPADFVLHAFSGSQRDELPAILAEADDAIECIITDGVAVAQNRYHTEARS